MTNSTDKTPAKKLTELQKQALDHINSGDCIRNPLAGMIGYENFVSEDMERKMMRKGSHDWEYMVRQLGTSGSGLARILHSLAMMGLIEDYLYARKYYMPLPENK